VGVPHRHGQRGMAKKLLKLLGCHPAHDRPGCEGVAQGVEVDVVELSGLDGVVVGRLDVAGFEDSACGLRTKADQRAVRVVVPPTPPAASRATASSPIPSLRSSAPSRSRRASLTPSSRVGCRRSEPHGQAGRAAGVGVIGLSIIFRDDFARGAEDSRGRETALAISANGWTLGSDPSSNWRIYEHS
jgi:hypothetical protein